MEILGVDSIIILDIWLSFGMMVSACGLIGTDDQTPYKAQDDLNHSVYLNLDNPATVNGTISEWKYCYYPPNNGSSSRLLTASFAVYRNDPGDNDTRYYDQVSDMFNITISRDNISTSNFTCDIFVPNITTSVMKGDVLGAYIPSNNNNNMFEELDIVSKNTTENHSLYRMADCSECGVANIPNEIWFDNLTREANLILHLFANITEDPQETDRSFILDIEIIIALVISLTFGTLLIVSLLILLMLAIVLLKRKRGGSMEQPTIVHSQSVMERNVVYELYSDSERTSLHITPIGSTRTSSGSARSRLHITLVGSRSRGRETRVKSDPSRRIKSSASLSASLSASYYNQPGLLKPRASSNPEHRVLSGHYCLCEHEPQVDSNDSLSTEDHDESSDSEEYEAPNENGPLLCCVSATDMEYSYQRAFEENRHQNIYENLKPYRTPSQKTKELYQQFESFGGQTIPRHMVEVVGHLGSGQFGKVERGRLKCQDGRHVDVALKTLNEGSSKEEKIKFLQEATIMAQFKHPNVVHLYGVMSKGEPMVIVVELVHKGDLLSILQSLSHKSNSQIETLPNLLLNFSQQVALGMQYLAGKGFVHRDLAARNILVSKHNICKVADFGMSRDLADENYYICRGGKIPVKWTAPEALNFKKYSTASDVWSYGCLLYEIWSLGQKPFSRVNIRAVLPLINGGTRLAPPPGCPRLVYEIMIKCWHPSKSKRPTFRDLFLSLNSDQEQVLSIPQEALNTHQLAGVLGAPLEAGEMMYTDLKCTYEVI